MYRVIKFGAIFLAVFLLSSCKQSWTYDYLMIHPEVLQKKISACEAHRVSECDVVDRAAYDFFVLVRERSGDPELFGLKVMQAQQEWVLLLQKYQEALREGDASKIKMAKEACQQVKQKIRTWYAVIAATTSPE